MTNHSLIWQRREDALWKTDPIWDGEVRVRQGESAKNTVIEIPLISKHSITQSQILPIVVNINYEISNYWKYIPLAGKLPRYFLKPINTKSKLPISLPPHLKSINFPLYIEPNTKPMLKLDVASLLPGVNFKITSLRYRILRVPEQNISALMDIKAE
ncbi:hypothetical protein [Coleofasciculus sp. FACHB-T130]|uniref:hypothetical protein n=1 Tax=Cyanophyceae TaxID=3028117 RepID=UPI0016866361|nr:hypothetical protein [Coleofasciculus sp. FACHB-T130]MBD1878304.1 hypothetical protein [Coleofasciculus sp. FACHB-T130]